MTDPNNNWQLEYGFPYSPDMSKRTVDSNDASSYGYIPEIPRLFLRSHIFGGSHAREPRNVLVYDHTKNSLYHRTITTPKLQERLYLEIISNAIDNAFKSQRMGISAPSLDITMNADTISIRSTGTPVPVDIHQYFYSQGQFGTVAELIFGVIGAGSNVDDTKTKQGGGQNGYGAKLTNVFSRYFEVEIGDNIRGFHQRVIWQKNMMEKVSSIITPQYAVTNGPTEDGLYHIYPVGERYSGENFVRITWKQDFRKFDCTQFSEDDFQLYMKYAAEASFMAKFRVTFNGVLIDCKSANQYVNMLPKSLNKNALIHYEFSQPVTGNQKNIEEAISNLQIIPNLELIVLDTPGQENMHISYCNGIYNVDGGAHTDTVYREVLKVIKDCIQSQKGQNIDTSKVTVKDIKNQCTVIINYRCNDPFFKGQDKEMLVRPAPKIQFSADEVLKIKKWNLTSVIYNIISGKALKGMTATRGRIKDDEKFRDADWFGTKNQNQCVMIICEGNSAGSYVRQWILGTPERSSKYCYLLLRGKFKNVTDMNLLELIDENTGNPEIKKLVAYMGFQYGVDYRTPEGAATLRYPYMYGMVDADSDGSHIQSLVKNFIYRFFPTFLMAGRFFYIPTPVIRILTSSSKGKTKKIFYNMFDYQEYVASIGNANHHPKYFKGLASGKTEFAKEDARVSPIVLANFDELASQAFDVAFKKGLTDDRKRWIEFWRDKIDTKVLHKLGEADPRLMYINISDYINTKLVEYSIDSFSRALPSYFDGLKKSQRQVLWYILTEWDFGRSRKGTVNLASIAADAKTKTKYHHGDLTETLARTGSDYPGSNNVPLIVQEGQFGTREHLGNDIGASRYVETEPEEIVKLIFDEELMKLVPVNVVENKNVEPKWIPSKLPIHIVNGALGVATAYSVEIPSYHPQDVAQWILNYITGQDCFPMIPWFRGFQGQVSIETVSGKRKIDESLLLENQETIKYYEGLTMTTLGNYQVLKERQQTYSQEVDGKKTQVTGTVYDILVTEIPIGVATAKYIFEMEKLCDKVSDADTVSTHNPILKLIGWKGPVSHKDLKLIKRTGLNNISLIDTSGIPTQLRNVYEALKLYCDNMINLYILLKKTRLENLEISIRDETKTVQLIELLLEDKIETKKQKESFIAEQLAKYDIEYSYYKKLSRRSESKEGYAEHLEKLNKLKVKYDEINNKHHLQEWCEDIVKLHNHFDNDPTYNKYDHHKYPFVPTNINDLISGRVKSPFDVKEIVEANPPI